MIICPTCKGLKTIGALLHYANGEDKYKYINCFTCNGIGEISESHLKRIESGKLMREDRISRGLSLREEAKRLGITPQELSHKENGRE